MSNQPTPPGTHAAMYYGFAAGALVGGYVMREGGWPNVFVVAGVALAFMAREFWRTWKAGR